MNRTTEDLVRRRLANQNLAASTLGSPADVVAWFGAVQAQEYPAARWALGLRARALTDRLVAQAFDAGEILRTHAMRPTWHFVARDDIRWLQMLTGPRVQALNAYYARKNELDAKTVARSRTVIERALAGGHQRTRTELAAVLGKAGIRAEGQRLAYLMMSAELDQLICSGPRRGKQFTYALLEERAPKALAAAARRGLAGAHTPVLHQSRAGNAARLRLVVRLDDGGCQARGGDRRTSPGAGNVCGRSALVRRVRPRIHPP